MLFDSDKEHEDYFMEKCYDYNVLRSGHYELRGGKHSPFYVHKNALYKHAYSQILSELCFTMAHFLYERGIVDTDIVAGPERGGTRLIYPVARHLSLMTGKDLFALSALKKERELADFYFPLKGMGAVEKVFVREKGFMFEPADAEMLRDKKVFVVDDVLTSGGSAKGVIDAIRMLGGIVQFAAVFWNRGNKTARDLNVTALFSVIKRTLPEYEQGDCPDCKEGRPLFII